MKAYIFDLDGTLFDSIHVWRDLDEVFLSKRGFPVPEDYAEHIASLTLPQAAEYTIKRFGLQEKPEDILEEWMAVAKNTYATKVKLKPYAKEYLTALKEQGAKLAIATSGVPELFMATLHNTGIFHLFDAICHAREVGVSKSKPDIFYLAAEKLNVHVSECVLFDDLLVALKTAKSIGMKTYGVYDIAAEKDWEEIKQTADALLYDFKDAPLPKNICYIVGAGENYGLDFEKKPGDYVIAADGGLDHIKKSGIVPDLFVGDIDSAKERFENEVILSTAKDYSDTMEAIKVGIKKGYDIFHIYCGTGGRFDHTFSNIQTLVYLSKLGKRGYLVGSKNITTAITNGSVTFSADGCQGFSHKLRSAKFQCYLSVFAYSEKATGVTLKGVKYELENATLENHLPIGLSNEFTDKPSEISVENGTLVIIFPRCATQIY